MADMDLPLSKARIVVFDTETTGLSPVDDTIIEIAALALEGGVETGRFEELVDPGRPIPPELTAIHGIDDAMVRGKPHLAEAAARFLAFAADAHLAAHNAPYDMAMMIGPMLEAGLRPAGNPVIDTCRLARKLIEAPNYRLGTIAGVLGLDISRAHRAMPDVEATARVLLECLRRMGEAATLADAERISAARLSFGLPGDATPLPDSVKPMRQAMETRATVEIVYRGGSHGDRPRRVTPLLFLELDGQPILAAVCHIDGVMKNFRVSQIVSVRSPSQGGRFQS